MSKEIEDQIREMAKLTMLSNKINPIQEKNLKMFPLVFFNGVKKAILEFDLCNGRSAEDDNRRGDGRSFVSYSLELDESLNANLEARFAHIESSVRNLFWSDTKVIVNFNGKKVFESTYGK